MVYYPYLCRRFFCCAFLLGQAGRQSTDTREVRSTGMPVVFEEASALILTGGAEMRVKITLACSECKQRNYDTEKNKKNDPDRLERNKYCRFCRKHTLHKETK